jgi:hypothetical protein
MFRRALRATSLLLCAGILAGGCGSSSAEEDAEESGGRTTIIAGSRTEPAMPPFPKGKPPKDLVVRWEESLPGMKVGGRREILVYIIDLIGISDPEERARAGA